MNNDQHDQPQPKVDLQMGRAVEAAFTVEGDRQFAHVLQAINRDATVESPAPLPVEPQKKLIRPSSSILTLLRAYCKIELYSPPGILRSSTSSRKRKIVAARTTSSGTILKSQRFSFNLKGLGEALKFLQQEHK